MTQNLPKNQAAFVTWIVTGALGIMSLLLVWVGYTVIRQQDTIDSLPEIYVRSERYTADQTRLEGSFCRINDKLDRLIEMRMSNGGCK